MNVRIIPLVLALLLSACGFHLRGVVDIPKWLNNVAVISQEADKQFTPMLRANLESYKIRVNPEPMDAAYWIVIKKINLEQNIVSIGASTNPRQYQLVLTVSFMLQTRKGEVLKPVRQVTVYRQLTVNNDRILGSNQEEALLINEMRQDAVIQIINRLSHE